MADRVDRGCRIGSGRDRHGRLEFSPETGDASVAKASGAGSWNVAAVAGTMGCFVRAAYPLMLDVSNRLAVIVGGGVVGARKARGLLDAGAGRVRVISPTFCESLPRSVERVERPYAT